MDEKPLVNQKYPRTVWSKNHVNHRPHRLLLGQDADFQSNAQIQWDIADIINLVFFRKSVAKRKMYIREWSDRMCF